MERDSVEVFLPDPDECYVRLRRTRFGATVSCVYCGESDPVLKKGTTGKGAQQYRCKECETYFNDLTDSFFEHRKFPKGSDGGTPWQLFDLREDPFETENLLNDSSSESIAAELHGHLRDRLAATWDDYPLKPAFGHEGLNEWYE